MKGKIFATVVAAALVAPFLLTVSSAQTAQPQVLMTWQASNSYVPAGYVGKILPNTGSQVTASLELISQGRAIDLSGQTIYWYLNDNLIGGGIGVQRIAFRPFGDAPNTLTLRASLPDYAGGLMHEINIPVMQPVVAIYAPYPGGMVSQNKITLTALPYFFNTSSSASLSFAWDVNGQAVADAENPQTLEISLPAGTPSGFAIATKLTATNPSDTTIAVANSNLVYQPHP